MKNVELPPLRPFQVAALELLHRESHLACVAPTGSGKSRIFEEFLLRNPKIKAVLISPLLALSRQQEEKLKYLGLLERVQVLRPESLQAKLARHENQFKDGFLIVDEAHLVLEWGDTFRPGFLDVFTYFKKTGFRYSLWLSATLTPVQKLRIADEIKVPLSECGHFSFPDHLDIQIFKVPIARRISILMDCMTRFQGQGIIFVATRKMVEVLGRLQKEVAPWLKVSGYHAGMSQEERRSIESKFQSGEIDQIISTSAFAMGIDIASLEWTILFQIPSELSTLVQMIGRVARSQKPGKALVLWSEEDFRVFSGKPSRSQCQIFDALQSNYFRDSVEKYMGPYCY